MYARKQPIKTASSTKATTTPKVARTSIINRMKEGAKEIGDGLKKGFEKVKSDVRSGRKPLYTSALTDVEAGAVRLYDSGKKVARKLHLTK